MADPVTPQEREREARSQCFQRIVSYALGGDALFDNAWEALDAYRSAVEARVRWEQQADAEGYTEGRP